MDKYVTTKEAANLIAERTGKPLSQRQLRHEIQLGHLKAIKTANTYLIELAVLENYTRRHPGKIAKKK